MLEVYLHIGTYKTGTTSIQNFLSNNQEKLLSKGFLYPKCGRNKKFAIVDSQLSHHNFVFALTKSKIYDPEAGDWEEFQKEIEWFQPEKAIISSEFFSDCKAEEVALVKDYLSKYQTKIIIYLRRQDNYFQSFYCEEVKAARYWKTLKEYISEFQHRGDYYNILEPWKKMFGQENIIVKVFEEEAVKNQLISRFLKSIDTNLDEEDFKKNKNSKNITPPGKTIKMMQIVSKILIDISPKFRYKLKNLYLAELLKSESKLLNMAATVPNFLINNELMSIQDRINVLKLFEESNRKVAQEYLGRENGQLFFSDLEKFV